MPLLPLAERAVDALNRDAHLDSGKVLARRLLRAESVASSRIEGLVLSQRRLAPSPLLLKLVNEAISVLAEKGVLHRITLAKRNRAWEARDLFDLINDVERELATPTDDDELSRPSPRRKTTSRT